jgi:polygalacturonase
MSQIKEYFPDGTPIDDWFYDAKEPKLSELGRQYRLTDYHIFDDGRVHTADIQWLIDKIADEGGGVMVVPAGIYTIGAVYFKQGVNLYIEEGATLKGSDNLSDYNLIETRIEGETCLYFDAMINVHDVDGFVMCGPGTIDGNGLKAWNSFWLRKEWNPSCTNKDEQRPRLVYMANCKNVTISGLHLQNSQFWTTHIYRCNHVKYINCHIFSPAEPMQAPSTDAIDIDVCTDILVKNCYMEVNDDAVVMKGGKGPWADKAEDNGSNERILVEDCTYGFCHACVTCGSESIHNRNVLVRRINVNNARNLLRLKMRPDTPQHYEYITVEDVKGSMTNFININRWTQFFDLKDRKDIPKSYADHVTMQRCNCECDTFFKVTADEEQYHLSDFVFDHLDIKAKDNVFDKNAIENMKVDEVNVG